MVPVLSVALALLATTFAPSAAIAAEATLTGPPTVSPLPLVPGKPAEVSVTLRAGAKATAPVQLEVRIGATVAGKLAEASLGANQTKTYKIGFAVPATTAKAIDLRILGWGAELGRAQAAVQAPAAAPGSAPKPAAATAPAAPKPPAAKVPSLTQTVTTAQASLTGNRGTQPPPPPLPSLTQTVTTPEASLTGNRGTQPPPPPVPSLTQTVTTPEASLTGNR